MQCSVVRLVLTSFAIMLMVAGLQVTAATAQEGMTQEGMTQEGTASNTVVHHGNTNIFFEKAGMNGLPSARYQAFEQFAAENPEIAHALTRNPRLIANENFIQSHPALADFVRANPDFTTAFAENPGNFVDMPLAVASSVKHHPIELQ
jgi:hypothetical protein